MNMNTNLWNFNNEVHGMGSVQLNIKWEKTLEKLKCIPWHFILPSYKVLLWYQVMQSIDIVVGSFNRQMYNLEKSMQETLN
jgi:hypothetical protein